MSDKNEPSVSQFQFPHPEMRAAVEASTGSQAADICEKLEAVFDDAIRKSCSKKQFEITSGNCKQECQTVEEPKIVPCLRLKWGDGPQDHLETDDTEVLCLTVCNPYSNVVLKDFNVQLAVLTSAGTAVPNQADGTPSVIIKPSFNICFDDIPACDPQKPNSSCVSREVVLINRGAVPGPYRIVALYCFEACFTKINIRELAVFPIDLVAS
ncbi:MAG: hypothetical protein QOF72_1652 [Blastocatellia bacterium]|jgi:hypothetical protein|nr:hypothetical protein [Blastocatellia bacterium]